VTTLGFVIQLAISALVIIVVCGRNDFVARVYVVAWLVLNFLVVIRYGVDGQLEFYSNDQRYYVNVIDDIITRGLSLDVDWWLTASRWPYTLPASVLSLAGLAPALSAKVVSLLFLLASLRLIRSWVEPRTKGHLLMVFYLTGLGAIGIFFSIFALRETAMMYLTLVIFFGKTPASKAAAILLLFFLRQHLAIAIAVGLIILTVLRRVRTNRWAPLQAVILVVLGNTVGYGMFYLGFQYLTGTPGFFGHNFGLRPVARIFSNYFGLQFLTAFEESLEFSLTSLLASRLLFSETIIIPLLFTALAVTSRRFNTLGQSILLAFSIYVGLVTNTEFNSFRQNIPLIPVMGLVVVQQLFSRQSSPTPSIDSRET
jgi:hypothetical protein